MNKARHQLTKQNRKMIRKEVKDAKENPPAKPPAKTDTLKKQLKKTPKRVAKKKLSLLENFRKKMQIKKTKNSSTKSSKRTTPGEQLRGSIPASVHPEGERWFKTLIKQTTLGARRLRRHLSKR